MRILAIDQSITNFASCFINIYKFPDEITIKTFLHKTKSKGLRRLWELHTHLFSLYKACEPEIFARELHNFSMSGRSNINHELNGIINLFAVTNTLDEKNNYYLVPPTVWKKFCLGRGNVGKDTGYLMKINKFLHNLPWWDYGDIDDDNIADAICIAITTMYIANYSRIKEGSLTKLQMDVLLKAKDAVIKYE